VVSNTLSKLTAEQYLTMERTAEFRSEFLNGEMFAMSGGSMNHAGLQANILVEVSVGLRGKECRAFGPDFRIKVSSRMYTYPDVSVVCEKPLLAGEQIRLACPSLSSGSMIKSNCLLHEPAFQVY
jgi:Uma2 family endonuclease